ncbi:HAMP domain-containing protein [Heliorestis acidaminivorans]|uniref:histidine kinase n=1 Tax=Heliorestis acidaminivorans TaxID=553427 RepID=A0A6I0EWJ5_9FIRM|nr:HAMP domain-containing sensor histidine kinase [Heliorestis acidaminivorans]KAB2951517.1 HAMP domain-containing protein [Heliorestis acidaminivorans]
MWSKIKKLPIPISIKINILYTSILFLILLITSVLTMTTLYYMLYQQAKNEVLVNADNVMVYLSEGKPMNEQLLRANVLSTDITLRIYDSSNFVIFDSNPYMDDGKKENRRQMDRPPKAPKDRFVNQIGKPYYTHTITWKGNQTYTLKFIKPMFGQLDFLEYLGNSLVITNIIGLFITIASGIYMSRKILRPIHDITSTAREIEVTDLSKRIHLGEVRDELHDLASTFNLMLDKIQNGFEQQRRFVSDASHELRTPITIISGYVNMLDRWGKEDPSVLEEGIEAIKTEASNMNQLIEKLLFLARTDQGKQIMNKEPIDIMPLIQEVYQETCLIAPNHQILLGQNESAVVSADAFFLKQMLRIFIDNSIKYTQSGGIISISSRKVDGHMNISIQDNGIGISEKDLDKIFERFYRVDKSRSKETGGIGLGLSIARWISEQHNSVIHIDSSLGKGTTITVKIPLPL